MQQTSTVNRAPTSVFGGADLPRTVSTADASCGVKDTTEGPTETASAFEPRWNASSLEAKDDENNLYGQNQDGMEMSSATSLWRVLNK